MKQWEVYSPPDAVKQAINYRVVWKDLPVRISEFVRVPMVGGGCAWSYENCDYSIWMLDSIMAAYRQKRTAVCIVSMKKQPRNTGRKDVVGMRLFEGSIDDAVKDAKDLNEHDLRRTRKNVKG